MAITAVGQAATLQDGTAEELVVSPAVAEFCDGGPAACGARVPQAAVAPTDIFLPVLAKKPEADALCRFGVNAAGDPRQTNLAALRAGWYMNYAAVANPPRPNGMAYMPVIRISPAATAEGYTYWPSGVDLENVIATNLGAKWLIGNEPDSPVQDNLEPAVYARAYHELYTLIKSQDPTAEIVAGSIVQATAIRLLYLDMVLTSYQQQFGQPLPADGWSIHNYILNEVSCQYDPGWCWGAGIPPGVERDFGEILLFKDNTNVPLFIERIVRFREWLAARGYGGQPLYVSEYGVLFWEDLYDEDGNQFPPSRVNAFMEATYDYLLAASDAGLGDPNDGYRLVQQWAWYSTTDTSFNGALFDPNTYAPSAMGQFFADYTADLASEVDFYPRVITADAGAAATVTLQAIVANSGNMIKPIDTVARFYDGHPQEGGTLIGEAQAVRLRGCGDYQVVSVQWSHVPSGTHQVYVQVATPGGVTETNTDNNVAVGQIQADALPFSRPVAGQAAGLP